MRRKVTAAAAGIAAVAMCTGVAFASAGSDRAAAGRGAPAAPTSSRLDDGKALLPQAAISESEAIAAAQGAASGALNEVDLEHYRGTLVFNVDVGPHDVKVDAATGRVIGSVADD